MKKFKFNIGVSAPAGPESDGFSLNKAVYDALSVVSRVNLNMLVDAATTGRPVVIPAPEAGKVGGVVRAGLVDVCGGDSDDIRPGRTGEWINGDDYEYEYAYCSECGHMQWVGWDSHEEACKKVVDIHDEYRFCPHCGTRMTGGRYEVRHVRRKDALPHDGTMNAVNDALRKVGSRSKANGGK